MWQLLSLGLIAVYISLIGLVARIAWQVVVVRKDGPVLWTFSEGHGVHESDLVAVVVGGALVGIFLIGIAIELRKLTRPG